MIERNQNGLRPEDARNRLETYLKNTFCRPGEALKSQGEITPFERHFASDNLVTPYTIDRIVFNSTIDRGHVFEVSLGNIFTRLDSLYLVDYNGGISAL